ncbi:MAG: alpha/beta hydrolase [Gemmatimonadaceae bacterium]|nr:alpha/beta hydrolase [Gemmatimonadaceae bacterium]
MKRLAKLLLVTVVIAYGGIVVALRLGEKGMVYQPAERAVHAPAPAFKLQQREVRFASGDGTELSAWIVPAAARDSSGMWLLICHGNYGNIGYGERPEFYAFARDIGLNLLAFDYRGFGDSGGAPDEAGFYRDAMASWRYLTDSLHVPPSRIIVFGHSLGSGVATELATRVDAAALVLEGAFTSVTDVGAEIYPLLPVRLLSTQRFPSLARIADVREPKLFLHSPEDDVIPYAHSQRLFAAAGAPKSLVAVRGGHMEAFSKDKVVYFGALAGLVSTVTPSSPVAAVPVSTVRRTRNHGRAGQ